MLSLALAMSIPPRKPKPQNQANLYTQMGEQSILRWNFRHDQWLTRAFLRWCSIGRVRS